MISFPTVERSPLAGVIVAAAADEVKRSDEPPAGG
jgi:hypothetical protein